jgi:hypothetical protein
MFYQKNCYYYGTYHWINQKDKEFSLDMRMSEGLGNDQIEVYWNIDIDITKMANGISCSYRYIFVSCGGHAVSKCNREEWSTNNVCL